MHIRHTQTIVRQIGNHRPLSVYSGKRHKADECGMGGDCGQTCHTHKRVAVSESEAIHGARRRQLAPISLRDVRKLKLQKVTILPPVGIR